jgi:glycerophosphoryl diester phosphodiesterase
MLRFLILLFVYLLSVSVMGQGVGMPVQYLPNVGHRGASFLAPENTLAAFQKAIDVHANGAECDVYATADGVLVLSHDPTTERTMGGGGQKITELQFNDIRKLDAGVWKDPKFKGEKVPALSEYLTLLKNSPCRPVIEIKMNGIESAVLDAVRKQDMLDVATVIAFSPEVVKTVRKLEPKICVAWLYGENLKDKGTAEENAERLTGFLIARSKELDTSVLDLDYHLLSEKLVRNLKNAGIHVWCWTVNDPKVMTVLLDWGVEIITTDRPELLHTLQNPLALKRFSALDTLGRIFYSPLMAKGRFDEEEEEKPVERKRRRPKKKPEDDEDGGGASSKKGPADDDEEEDENSISTGNILLDIVLDFFDDCIDWAKAHFFYAIIIFSVSFLLIATFSFLTIRSIVKYIYRPTLPVALTAYDLGSYPEAKDLADRAMEYVSPNDPVTRAGLLFVMGASACSIAESTWDTDQTPYYLAAANYLKESSRYGFAEGRLDEGYFLLGKSLYSCDEFVQCREPLEAALDRNSPQTKTICWYLANAYFLGASPDLQRALNYLHIFQTEPTVLEEEKAESYILEALIYLYQDKLDEGKKTFAKVPRFERFAVMRHFVNGGIDFLTARRLRKQAIELETNPNPISLPDLPVAPVPVKPEAQPPAQEKEEKPKDEAPPVAIFPVGPEAQSPARHDTRDNFPVQASLMVGDPFYQRLADLRPKYASDADDAKVIVLPKEDTQNAAPVPAKMTEAPTIDPAAERAKEFRELANAKYREAIAHFMEVRRQSTFAPRWIRAARLFEGIAYEEMNEFTSAEEAYLDLVDAFPTTQEAASANYRLGCIDRQHGRIKSSFRAFARSFDYLRNHPEYANFLVSKETIIAEMTEMIRKDIVKRDYSDAVALLKLLRGVMPPADISRMKGETYEGWAQLLQSQADAVFGEQGNKLAKDAAEKLKLAGESFEELADLVSDTPEYTALIWRSAENYRGGKDYRRGIAEYRRYMRANPLMHRPEVQLYLGQLYLNLDMLDESASILEGGLASFPTHALTPQLRLVLSRTYYEQDRWKQAKDLLKQNLVGEFAPNSAIYRDSMFALGRLCYEKGEIEEAIPYLEDAVKIHPDAIQAAEAHYNLSQAYVVRANEKLKTLENQQTDTVQGILESQVTAERQIALTHIQQAGKILLDRQQAVGLTPSEKLMLRNAQFGAGSILMKMNMYDQAISLLNIAATRYQDQPESLDALMSLALALRKIGRVEESKTTLNRAEVVLNQLEKNGTIPAGSHWAERIRALRK